MHHFVGEHVGPWTLLKKVDGLWLCRDKDGDESWLSVQDLTVYSPKPFDDGPVRLGRPTTGKVWKRGRARMVQR